MATALPIRRPHSGFGLLLLAALLVANLTGLAADRLAAHGGFPGLSDRAQSSLSQAPPPDAAQSYDEVASDARVATHLLGRSYGKAGTVVENPGLRISGLRGANDPYHAIKQIVSREVSAASILDTVRNPSVVLRQSGGNFLHLSPEAGVVLRSDGQVVTAYSSAQFKPHILQILEDAGATG